MNKETLINKLLDEIAEKNNTICLNAYALGLDAMYEALVSCGAIKKPDQLFCENCGTAIVSEEGD